MHYDKEKKKKTQYLIVWPRFNTTLENKSQMCIKEVTEVLEWGMRNEKWEMRNGNGNGNVVSSAHYPHTHLWC